MSLVLKVLSSVFVWLLLLPHFAFGLEIKLPVKGIQLGRQLDILEDPSRNLSFEDLRNGESEKKFKRIPSDTPNFGYFSKSRYWARFTLTNNSADPIELYMVSRYATLDFVSFYFPDHEGKYGVLTLGDQVPYVSRPIPYRYPTFPFTLAPGTHTFYVMINTEGSSQFSLSLWDPHSFLSHEIGESEISGLLLGICVAMLLYNLFVYFKFKSRAYATYVFYILCYLLFALTYHGYTQQLFVPEVANSWLMNVGLLLMIDTVGFAAMTFSIDFLNLKTRSKKSLFVMRGLQALLLLNILNRLTLQIFSMQMTIMSSLIISLVLLVIGTRISINYRPARYFMTAWAFIILGNITVILAGSGVLPLNLFTSWAQMVGAASEMILLSFALGDRMSLINEEREEALKQQQRLQISLFEVEKEKASAQEALLEERELSIRELDRKVAERTRDIRSILATINQGIFIIGKENESLMTQHEFSQFMITLLQTKNIGGKDPIELVFGQARLSSDVLSQIKQVLLNCLQEDVLNFELNSSLLVTELILNRIDGSSVSIEMDWVPILDSSGRIDKILVTMKDVSQIRKLREDARVHEQTLLITGELTTALGRKFPRVRKSFFDGLESIKKIMQKQLDRKSISKADRVDIMRFLHTAKGEARVYGLRILAQCIHEIESETQGKETFTREDLMVHFRLLEDLLAEYNVVWVDKLGFQDDDEERITIAAHMVQKIFDFIDKVAFNAQEIPPEEYTLLKHKLNLALGTDLENVIHEQLSDLKLLSKETEKAVPNVLFQGASVTVPKIFHPTIRQVVGHLLRNSIVHGIESRIARLAKGKPMNGTIAFSQSVVDGHYILNYRDDGQGLQLRNILIKAKLLGLIENEAKNLGPQEKAELIFAPGLSTEENVSMIAGRGIGMLAVRELLEECGAHIRIILGKELDHFEEIYSFSFEIVLPFFESQNPIRKVS